MERTSKSARPCSSGLDYIPGLMESDILEAVFLELPADSHGDQDSPTLRNWFNEILRTCRGTAEFMVAMASARRFTPEPGKPFFRAPLAATTSDRLSLVGIHPTKPIPLHDHPNGWSAQMILAGQARIRQFDIDPGQADDSSQLYLRAVSFGDFGIGEISTVTPGARNIHSLAAKTTNLIMLSVDHLPSGASAPSWYFPVVPLNWKNPLLLCHRVNQETVGAAERTPGAAGSSRVA